VGSIDGAEHPVPSSIPMSYSFGPPTLSGLKKTNSSDSVGSSCAVSDSCCCVPGAISSYAL